MAVNSTVYDWKVLKSLKLHVVQPVQIATTNNCGDNCALLLTQSGKVFAIGKSNVGCLGLGVVKETAEPVELKELSGVAGVCVCGSLGDALAYTSEGKVYEWGNNACCKRPQLVPELTDVADAKCLGGHYLALTKSGKLYEWRGGTTIRRLSITPKVVTLNKVITSIACGPQHSLALTKDGQVYSWGYKWERYHGIVYQPMTKITLPGETVAKVVCGDYHSLVLTHTGKLYTWGHNECGLGDPSGSTKSATPVQVGQNIGRFVDIAVNGWATNAAVSNTGAVYMWGEGENDADAKTSTITAYLEIHQVFAKINPSNYSWTPKTPISNMVVVKDLSSVAGKLKASCNDEQDCNKAAIIHPEGHLEQSQTNADCDHAESKIHDLEEYVKNLKKELAGLKEENIKLKEDLKEDNTKLKEENAKLKEEIYKLKDEIYKFKNELKEDHAKLKDELREENAKQREHNVKLKEENYKFKNELKEESAKLAEDLKEDNAKLLDQFNYLKAFILPQEQEEKGKHNEVAITQPEERGLQLPVYLAQLEHDPTNVDSSNNIEEDNVEQRKGLAKLQDQFKNLKALLFPQERERSSCEDNKDREIQRGRRGRITPTTASVTHKDNNQNKQ